MNILLLSAGGGGGNILRSLKALFARDVATAQKSDARFAERGGIYSNVQSQRIRSSTFQTA